ncbi:hypothetical protein [Acetobacter sp. DmW_043]|uniref:hypothetical protein n=1 Tax=Acetobacter sp. DmW_043 TaxID=1670658 RepID=UPI000A39A80A|nr:hypothetical protein [Acetobacter sp. DmW_043]
MPRHLIDAAINTLIHENSVLFHHGLHEQTLVGRLSCCLQTAAIEDEDLQGYYADVEYNRAKDGVYKGIQAAADNNNEQRRQRVFVDLVLHGRGLRGNRENIICCEMKKRSIKTAWITPEQAATDIFRIESIAYDQEKLLTFTSDGNPHNVGGDVVGYEIGVLIVPRYDSEGERNDLVSRIQEVFVRYYAQGAVLEGQDRIIGVPAPL